MPSTISAGTTGGTAIAFAGDTSGELQLRTNGTTPAVTISTAQNATFVGSVSARNTFGFENRIINGAMVIDQRNAGASVSTGSGTYAPYTLDRWVLPGSGGGVFSYQQSSVAPAGFVNSALITVTTADSSIAAGDYYQFRQAIEGFNIADLGWGTANAKTVTLSFWVRSSLTGTFGLSLRNGNGDRSYVATYVVNAANTWEQKTVTIPGDTAGTWTLGTTVGMYVTFSLGVGSSFESTANSWQAGSFVATSGSVDLVGTNGATWQVTGVQLEVGSLATSFDFRSIGQELALCQRYYETSYAAGTAIGTATITNTVYWYAQSSGNYNNQIGFFKVPKRAAPTTVIYSALGTSGKITNSDANTDVNGRIIQSQTNQIVAGADNVSIGQWVALTYHYTASSEL